MSLLSVIIPAFNEEDNVNNTIDVLANILEDNTIDYELIFISDGSKDNTYKIVEERAKCDSRIKGMEFSRNFGKESAIFAGLDVAKGDCCIIIDCDLQHPPEVVPKMYNLWKEGYEVVEGIKSSRGKESIFYKLSAGFFYKAISKLINIDMEASSDFKLLDRKVMDVLISLNENNTFFRALSFWVGFKSTSIEFDVAERVAGESKWSLKSLIKYAIHNITAFTTAPLQFITIMGTCLIILSVVLGIQTLIRYMLNESVEGFTTVILLLLVIGGSIMVSLGIIGHYIAKTYEEIKHRPKYIVANKTDNL